MDNNNSNVTITISRPLLRRVTVSVVLVAIFGLLLSTAVQYSTIMNESSAKSHDDDELIRLVKSKTNNNSRSSSSSNKAHHHHHHHYPGDSNDIAGECYKGEKQWWKPARCPPDEWWLDPWVKKANIPLSKLLQSSSSSSSNSSSNTNKRNRPLKRKKWTLVDVGGNKGYTLTAWTEQLFGSNRTRMTAHNLGVALFNKTKQFYTMSHCGGCCECSEPATVLEEEYATRKEDVRIIAYEPGPATARHLKEFFMDEETKTVDAKNSSSSIVDIRWKAVADKKGKALFPDVPIGKETGKLVAVGGNDNDKSGPKMVELDVVTLDEDLKELYEGDNAPGIDVLTTDVEGLDQDVAKGARKLLSSGKVGVYIFEMNRAENYTTVFSWLHDVAGFECYFGTERRFVRTSSTSRTYRYVPPLIRITGPCWKPEYEGYSGWINAICVHRRRAADVIPIVGALTKKRWKIKLTCNGRKEQQKVVGKFLRQNLKKEMEELEKNKK